MSETKLKPCPFCGCSNIQFWETDNDTHRFQIVCMQCFNGTDECISEEVAIEKWNCRRPMANIVEKLEEEKEKAQEEMEECIFKGLPYHDSTEGKVIGINKAINMVKQEINNKN